MVGAGAVVVVGWASPRIVCSTGPVGTPGGYIVLVSASQVHPSLTYQPCARISLKSPISRTRGSKTSPPSWKLRVCGTPELISFMAARPPVQYLFSANPPEYFRSAFTNSRATALDGPPPPGLFQPCATARIRFACAGLFDGTLFLHLASATIDGHVIWFGFDQCEDARHDFELRLISNTYG